MSSPVYPQHLNPDLTPEMEHEAPFFIKWGSLPTPTARRPPPGPRETNWHRDGNWPMDPAGTPYGSLPGQINCGYYLDQLTEENGGICIVPGSHRAPFRPPADKAIFPDQQLI